MTAFIIISLLVVLWLVSEGKKEYECDDERDAGFENNNYYFQGNENDTMYIGNLIQPKLKHKLRNSY